ncbi:MAG TPA: retropepsin-like aspartic protease, partial [Nitrospira sp.]|nr:retropepsin-like aspartic protease [Nitrospira sp.]
TETLPLLYLEGGYMEGYPTSPLSLRKMEQSKPPRFEEETAWRLTVIKNTTPLDTREDPMKYRCLRILGTINGHPVRCLADSGSTADVISSDVVGLYSFLTAPLSEMLIIKMACISSRVKAN